MSFRDIKIPESEAQVLTELEQITHKKFMISTSFGYFLNKITFKTKDQHVIGIYLDSGCKRISNLPESIRNLKYLNELRLFGAQLTAFPQCLLDLPSLNQLGLVKSRLDTIPESIGALKSLYLLDLSENNLSSLPNSIGNLKVLTALNLEDNRFVNLPESIGEMDNLKILNLKKNPLKELPDSILKLKALTDLYIGTHLEKTTDQRTIDILEVIRGRGIAFERHVYYDTSYY